MNTPPESQTATLTGYVASEMVARTTAALDITGVHLPPDTVAHVLRDMLRPPQPATGGDPQLEYLSFEARRDSARAGQLLEDVRALRTDLAATTTDRSKYRAELAEAAARAAQGTPPPAQPAPTGGFEGAPMDLVRDLMGRATQALADEGADLPAGGVARVLQAVLAPQPVTGTATQDAEVDYILSRVAKAPMTAARLAGELNRVRALLRDAAENTRALLILHLVHGPAKVRPATIIRLLPEFNHSAMVHVQAKAPAAAVLGDVPAEWSADPLDDLQRVHAWFLALRAEAGRAGRLTHHLAWRAARGEIRLDPSQPSGVQGSDATIAAALNMAKSTVGHVRRQPAPPELYQADAPQRGRKRRAVPA